jgi:hypothetical protein
MTRYLRAVGTLVAIAIVLAWPGTGTAQTGDLVGLLTSQLGVSESQAAGGAGSLFNFAKGQMSAGDFDAVSGALPEVNDLMGAAPESGGGVLGSASSLLDGSSGGLENMAGVADAFSGLGMSPDMVNEFVPVILDYAQSTGGEQTMQLLQTAFTAL